MAFQCGARRAGKVRHSYATLAGLGAYILTTHKETTMPFRFRRSIKILPGVCVNVGHKGISSVNVGRTNFRKGRSHACRSRCSGACRGSLEVSDAGDGGPEALPTL